MNETIINEIRRTLEKTEVLPHEASTLGYEMFFLKYVTKDENSDALIERFKKAIQRWDLTRLITIQEEYICRIINAEHIEYEEIHKVFSLCEEIYALEKVGLNIEENERRKFKEQFELFLRTERKRTAMVAQERKRDWSKDLWFYQS